MVGNRTPVYPDLVLVKEGAPRAKVVLSKHADEKVKSAAADLCDIIERMSGARLPLVDDSAPVEGPRILVGESRETHCPGDRDAPRISGKRTGDPPAGRRLPRLLGNDDGVFTGTQFAVTMLLERLGCGWFAPTSFGR